MRPWRRPPDCRGRNGAGAGRLPDPGRGTQHPVPVGGNGPAAVPRGAPHDWLHRRGVPRRFPRTGADGLAVRPDDGGGRLDASAAGLAARQRQSPAGRVDHRRGQRQAAGQVDVEGRRAGAGAAGRGPDPGVGRGGLAAGPGAVQRPARWRGLHRPRRPPG